MNIRHPIRAGSFYESSAASCLHHATRLLEGADVEEQLPGVLYGGLVPHAGWMYSGRLAAKTLKALHTARPLKTVVLLGADHTGTVQRGELYDSGVWRTPLGEVAVDDQLASALLAGGDCLRANVQAHAYEHSLEVQVPLLQALAPEVRIVPIAVPPSELALEIGEVVGSVLAEGFADVPVIGSTDLTHHGGHFPAPGGHGKTGVVWTEQNDRRMIDLVVAMDSAAIVPEARARSNACGAGAVAAAVVACSKLGATRGICLE